MLLLLTEDRCSWATVYLFCVRVKAQSRRSSPWAERLAGVFASRGAMTAMLFSYHHTFVVFSVRIAGGVHDLWLNTDIADTFAVFSVINAGGVQYLRV